MPKPTIPMPDRELVEAMYARVLAKCVESGGCLLWTGATGGKGYGRINGAGRLYSTHRVAWWAEHGEIPTELEPDHTCENKRCVRHLELVTHLTNMRRMYARRAQLAA